MKYIISENENKIWTITAFDKEMNVGSLQFYLEENILHIKYIFVEEKYRNQGVGSGLILQANTYVKNNVLEGMIFTMVVPKDIRYNYERFLIKNGFNMPESDGLIITVEIDKLKDTYIEKLPYDSNIIKDRIYGMNKLPLELKTYFERNIRNNIDKGYMPEYILGDMVSDLSFAIEKEGMITSYVIFSLYENELYLSSAYVDSKNVSEIICLLKHCFMLISEKYRQYATFKIRTINLEGYYLFKKLINGADNRHEAAIVTYKFF